MTTTNLFGIPIAVGSYDAIVKNVFHLAKRDNGSYVCLLNVHMLIEGYKNPSFQEVIANAGIVAADGVPVTWALRLLQGLKQERVAGMDLLPDVLHGAMQEELPVYFYGGSNDLLTATDNFVQCHFPSLEVKGYYSPPFRDLTAEELDADAERINASGAKIVFVVLGCPKQERWMAAMKGKVNALMIGIGGALPVMVGMHKRAPRWMQRNGLEWFYRLSCEPERLFKRYVFTNSVFIFILIKSVLRRVVDYAAHPISS